MTTRVHVVSAWCVRVAVALVSAVALAAWAPPLQAQVIPDSMVRDSIVPPVVRLPEIPDSGAVVRRRAPDVRPPISPRRAFFMSFLVPGLAQARLDRATSGALFATVEMGSFAMLRRSSSDVREVRRQEADPIPGNFTVNPGTGALTPAETVPPRFDEGLERTRKLHVEDWLAAIAFNHLISGADAFVAAQLWDVPVRVAVVPSVQGMMLTAAIRF